MKQSHPSELSKKWKKEDACWGDRLEREGQIEELVGDQNPGSEAPPRSKKGEERRIKGNVRRGATARGAM